MVRVWLSRCLAVVAAGAGTAAAVPATPAIAASLAGPSITATTVVSGVVTKNGVRVSGAEVVAQAQPSPEVQGKAPAGATYELQVVAREVTDKHGRFAISIDPRRLGGTYVAHNGAVDLTLVVADEAHEVRWSFTATPAAKDSPGRWGNPRVTAKVANDRLFTGQAPTRLSIDLGDAARVIEEGNDPATWVGEDGQPLGAVRGLEKAKVHRETRTQPAGIAPYGPCTITILNEWQYDRIEMFVTAQGSGYAPVSVWQEYNAAHTMGIAATDSSGRWSQTGELTRSFGASADTPFGSGSKTVYNRVTYRKSRLDCGTYTAYKWEPVYHNSLNSGWAPITTPYWPGCVTYYGGTYTKDQGYNVKFSTGVNLTVLNVSAHSAFSATTKLKWTFSGTARLCGSSSSHGWVSSAEAGSFPA